MHPVPCAPSLPPSPFPTQDQREEAEGRHTRDRKEDRGVDLSSVSTFPASALSPSSSTWLSSSSPSSLSWTPTSGPSTSSFLLLWNIWTRQTKITMYKAK